MNKRYILQLSSEERSGMRSILSQTRLRKKRRRNTHILLCTDQGEGGKAMTDEQISKAYDVTVRTVRNVRKRCVEEGIECGINGKARQPDPSKLKVNTEIEDQIVGLSQQVPPQGFSSWSLRLLADQLVELEYIESISHEKVRQVLKKTR